jgi:hypothetical protein
MHHLLLTLLSRHQTERHTPQITTAVLYTCSQQQQQLLLLLPRFSPSA